MWKWEDVQELLWKATSQIARRKLATVEFFDRRQSRSAFVGTANFDNRSVRLNFEVTLIFADRKLTAEIATMLEQDFTHCHQVTTADFASKPIWFHFAVRLARLMSPIL